MLQRGTSENAEQQYNAGKKKLVGVQGLVQKSIDADQVAAAAKEMSEAADRSFLALLWLKSLLMQSNLAKRFGGHPKGRL